MCGAEIIERERALFAVECAERPLIASATILGDAAPDRVLEQQRGMVRTVVCQKLSGDFEACWWSVDTRRKEYARAL